MTTTKQHRDIKRGGSVLRGRVLTLLVALIAVTQLLESISITNIVSMSIYLGTSSTTGIISNNEYNDARLRDAYSDINLSSTGRNLPMIQRRSSIATHLVEYHNDIDVQHGKDDQSIMSTSTFRVEQTSSVMMSLPSHESESTSIAKSALTTTPVVSEVETNAIASRIKVAGDEETTLAVSNTMLTPTTEQKSNRTLVIVLGNVRGGEPAWKSMIREVLDPNMADLALLIGEGDPNEISRPTLLHERAKYIWTKPEFDDWADAMEGIPDKPHDWRERLFGMTDPSRPENILLGAAHNISGSGALVFMFRFYLSQKLVENNLLSKYNRFVVTRSDHYYLCAHDLSQLSNDYLWVPTGSDYYGICDRHFIASNETILSALDVLPPLVRNPEAYREQLQSYPYNTERFLLYRWEQEGLRPRIQRFDRNMFLVASSTDNTRWKTKGRYIENLDVYLKYSREYRLSAKTCRVRQVREKVGALPAFIVDSLHSLTIM